MRRSSITSTPRIHGNIVTIEEPIEFVHNNKQSIITQREVPRTLVHVSGRLKAALREDCDIVLVGEMRDLETDSLALTAALRLASWSLALCTHEQRP